MTKARCGLGSTKRLRMLWRLKLTLGSVAPVPRVAPGAAPMIGNGAVAAVFKPNSYGSGNTSNRPKPARTAVLLSLNGSHARPIRGSKLYTVGFELIGLFVPTGPHKVVPGVQLASV